MHRPPRTHNPGASIRPRRASNHTEGAAERHGPAPKRPFTSALTHSRTPALSLLLRPAPVPAIMYAHPLSSGGPFMVRNAAHV